MKAVFRTAKLSSFGNIGGLSAHCERTMEVPNASKEHQHLNEHPIGSNDMVQDVKNRLKEAGITQIRKNGVLAFEVVLSASPEFFKMSHEEGGEITFRNGNGYQKWKKQSMDWLHKEFGKNLVNVHLHLDEKTPHFQALIVPIDEKGKLNCRDFLGGREKLSQMQDRYADSIADLGIDRGVKKIKGEKDTHQDLKTFYAILPPKIEALEEKVMDLQEQVHNEDGELQYIQEMRRQAEADLSRLELANKLKAEEIKALELAHIEKEMRERKTMGETLKTPINSIDLDTLPKMDLRAPNFEALEPKTNAFGVITRESHDNVVNGLKNDFNEFYKNAVNPINNAFIEVMTKYNDVFNEINRKSHALDMKERWAEMDKQKGISKPIQK